MTTTVTKQQSLADFVDAMEQAGLLVRVKDEKRTDELPGVMEAHPDQAVLVEKVRDCEFQFLANAYSSHKQYAWALGCKLNEVALKLTELTAQRIKPKVVNTAPCKEVILKDDEVDLTKLPLFLHHDRDANAYLNDTRVIHKDPETGIPDIGVYRLMFRTKNETGIDLTVETHRLRQSALKAQAKGENLPIAVVIGGPTLDKMAALSGVPSDTDDFEVLGGYYGSPAQLVKCETVDLFVPANAEIVLEGEITSSEGWVHDEGPYGEFTGMYGGGMKHNNRVVYHCMTYRKNGIYQHATIGGSHPWLTDNMLQLPAIEGDIYEGLVRAGIDVLDVRADPGGLSQIAYAKIHTQAGGDAKQALGIMLTCSKQGLPKIAMVFDEDVDIWNDERVKWAMAFRYMPDLDTLIIPQCNTLLLDPMVGSDTPPVYASKLGLDCTIPLVGHWDRHNFDQSTAVELGDPPANIQPISGEQLVEDMRAFLKQKPRSWNEISKRYLGQPYPVVYQAFSSLRHELGRTGDSPWYPYTFSDQDFASAPTVNHAPTGNGANQRKEK